jgi:hypothetical protein
VATTRYSFTFSTADIAPFGPFPRWIVGEDAELVAALNDALMSASRGDWLHFVLSRVRDRLGGKALDFLFEDPYSGRSESDESQFLLTAIGPAELPGAIALADAWRAALFVDPEILATACERDVEFVREQLASAEQEAVFHGVSEDGDEPAYLVGFLRALRQEFARAQAAGETTIHVRLGG